MKIFDMLLIAVILVLIIGYNSKGIEVEVKTSESFNLSFTPQSPLNPSYRKYTSLAYDSESDRVILFGGDNALWNFDKMGYYRLDDFYFFLNDTWAYDLNTNSWQKMNSQNTPISRHLAAMAYDSESDRIILFGGFRGSAQNGTFLNDTWAYDYNNNSWQEMQPVMAPLPRISRMIYDSESDRVVLFSGHRADGQPDNDVWVYNYNNNTWVRFNTSGPSARSDFGMAYNSRSDKIIIFGGSNEAEGGFLNDTWIYDFNNNNWTRINTNQSPSSRTSVQLVYDNQSDKIILHGGQGSSYMYDTWAYDYNTNTWTNITNGVPYDTGLVRHTMTYDSESDRLILFGGITSGYIGGDIWAFDYEQSVNPWRNMHPTFPRGRFGFDMVALNDGKLFLYGHSYSEREQDTWLFDMINWTSLHFTQAPQSRFELAIAYDTQSDIVILFGGATIYGSDVYIFNDTWEFNPVTRNWTLLNPLQSPPPSRRHRMVYDSESDKIILFTQGQTWAYDYNTNTWQNMTPNISPQDREFYTLGYDSESDRTILFGGVINSSGQLIYMNDTWVYNYNNNTWWQMSNTSMEGRWGAAMIYNPRIDRIILFGGSSTNSEVLNDTWLYDYNNDRWERANNIGNSISARTQHQMIYDTINNRTILFGGYVPGHGAIDDLYFIQSESLSTISIFLNQDWNLISIPLVIQN